jgi:hypothetical protein
MAGERPQPGERISPCPSYLLQHPGQARARRWQAPAIRCEGGGSSFALTFQVVAPSSPSVMTALGPPKEASIFFNKVQYEDIQE